MRAILAEFCVITPPACDPLVEDNVDQERLFSSGVIRHPLQHIAFWQGSGFAVLILLIWVSHVLNLPALYYGGDLGVLDLARPCVLTAAAIICGFITVGHTYVQQKRILKGFLTVCSYCRRVKVDEEAWSLLERYLSQKTLVEFSHGICPECSVKLLAEIEEQADEFRLASSEGRPQAVSADPPPDARR